MKEILKQVISQFHSQKPANVIVRDTELPVDSGKIISVLGVRRCGKTYLLYQVIQQLLSAGIPLQRMLYLNMEDERIILKTAELDLILQAYRELYPKQNLEDCYFFFDEIQNVPNWEKFIRRLYDSVSKHVFITGSNSKLLGSEIATALRGRTLPYTLYPLSFNEYLRFLNITPNWYNPAVKHNVLASFQKFMVSGGYPELINTRANLRDKLLQEYFNVMIYRDLVERYNISNIIAVKYFIKKVFASITKPISISRVYNDLKSNKYEVGKEILYTYFEHLNATFFTQVVQKFDFSELRSENAEKKAYVIDNGLISAVDLLFYRETGKQLENLVALEFFKAGVVPRYFKQIKECDFIINIKGENIPIQVCSSLKDDDTRKREFAGLEAACTLLQRPDGILLTIDDEYETTFKNCTIKIIPVSRFVLFILPEMLSGINTKIAQLE